MSIVFASKPTAQQREIMEWVIGQGTARANIRAVELTGPALIRVTKADGHYIDVYCDAAGEVRILNVRNERETELAGYWVNETDDPATQVWRKNLSEDEKAMMEQRDINFHYEFEGLAEDAIDAQHGTPNLIAFLLQDE